MSFSKCKKLSKNILIFLSILINIMHIKPSITNKNLKKYIERYSQIFIFKEIHRNTNLCAKSENLKCTGMKISMHFH